jgi:hypothetical protein
MLINDNIVFCAALAASSGYMDFLLVGPVLAISTVATVFAGKFMLQGFVSVLERRRLG